MEKNGVEVITFGDKKWLNEKNIETQLELSNLVDLVQINILSNLEKKARITKLL